jgi:ATP-dependent Clp protease ATP-binding subunit ClpA
MVHWMKVTYDDQALEEAARLSARYITDRFLPDKAIDLIDEAAAMIRTEIDSLPSDLDEITRRIMQLEIEKEALKKEKDPGRFAQGIVEQAKKSFSFRRAIPRDIPETKEYATMGFSKDSVDVKRLPLAFRKAF